ncbi:hypothetical protein [Pseudomonas sp. R5(2019)]|nr:hypothetical protein [Pseudomonas sp. R5(2019)]
MWLEVRSRGFDLNVAEGAFGNVYAYPGAPRTVQAGISYTL